MDDNWFDEHQLLILGTIGLLATALFSWLAYTDIVDHRQLPVVCRELRYCIDQGQSCEILQRACAEESKK